MRHMTTAGVLLALTATAAAFELSPEVSAMTAAEYNELSMFVRAEIMTPIAETAGVSYFNLNVCLKTAAVYPEYRNWRMPRSPAGCIQTIRAEQK